MKQNSRVLTLLLACILPLAIPFQATGSAITAPFKEGERLLYKAKWGAIPAGQAVIETLPLQTIEGRQYHHFALTARTSPRVDTFYTIRERQDSFTDLRLMQTLQYAKKGTGSRKRDVVVNFDWKNLTATSVDSGKPRQPVKIVPGTMDPLALIFSIRMKRLEVGQMLEIPVSDGKKCVPVRVGVTGRETLNIDDKSYDTFIVDPDMDSLSGFFKKGRQIRLWYSADEQQMPVRMQSRFPLGDFVFELVENES
ncbi:MAG: DUF3108 domain-containing protein [Desulfobacteraceae bacterium]|nr:MAG: DUF3108 domain-containing protein [Desulfobacteraceae bacterium]